VEQVAIAAEHLAGQDLPGPGDRVIEDIDAVETAAPLRAGGIREGAAHA